MPGAARVATSRGIDRPEVLTPARRLQRVGDQTRQMPHQIQFTLAGIARLATVEVLRHAVSSREGPLYFPA